MANLKPLPPMRRKDAQQSEADQASSLAAKLLRAVSQTLSGETPTGSSHILNDLGSLAAELQLTRVCLETVGEVLGEAGMLCELTRRRVNEGRAMEIAGRLQERIRDLAYWAHQTGSQSRPPLTIAPWSVPVPIAPDTWQMRKIPLLFQDETLKPIFRTKPDVSDPDAVHDMLVEAHQNFQLCHDAVMDAIRCIENAVDGQYRDQDPEN